MLEYLGENHGLAKRANQKDYTVRMKEFFDHFLMGKPMPNWYAEGVQRLDMDDHLKTRLQTTKPPAAKSGESAESKEKQNEKQNCRPCWTGRACPCPLPPSAKRAATRAALQDAYTVS
jgi:hypothetical protein